MQSERNNFLDRREIRADLKFLFQTTNSSVTNHDVTVVIRAACCVSRGARSVRFVKTRL